MISSGMIPCGEKKQDDLSRTQYGTVPSPDALSDVYKKIYKEENIDEMTGGTPKITRLKPNLKDQADAVKRAEFSDDFDAVGASGVKDSPEAKKIKNEKIKKGRESFRTGQKQENVDLLTAYRAVHEHHKKDADGNTIPHDGEDLNEVDKFDVVFNHFISEGYSEKEAYAKMSNLTEEQLDEFLKALAQAGMRGAQSVGRATKGIATAAAQHGQKLGKPQAPKPRVSPGQMSLDLKGAGMQDRTAPKSPSEVVEKDSAFQAKKRMAKAIRVAGTMAERQRQRDNMKEEKIDEAAFLAPLLGKVAAIAGKGAAIGGKVAAGAGKAATTGAKVTSTGGKVVQGASKGTGTLAKAGKVLDKAADLSFKTQMIGGMIPKPSIPSVEKKSTANVSAGSYQAASADLFDIVKGQLLDEGLSEEEIRDIMLTLTPDEILKEMKDKPYEINVADAKANTPAYQNYMKGMKSKVTGKPMYKASQDMKDRAKGLK
jgi:hypothetical protein